MTNIIKDHSTETFHNFKTSCCDSSKMCEVGRKILSADTSGSTRENEFAN